MFDHHRDLDRFYEHLDVVRDSVGGARVLGECHGKLAWPTRGVYFLFDPGERRAGSTMPRVVRVGTHAVSAGSTSTLWQRLRTHRGTRAGGGNHRSSIFRLHVGAALIARTAGAIDLPTWGKRRPAPPHLRESEREHEAAVSRYLGRLRVLWLSIDDEPGPESARSYIEKNAIGLLTRASDPIDPPSGAWLVGDHPVGHVVWPARRAQEAGTLAPRHLRQPRSDAPSVRKLAHSMPGDPTQLRLASWNIARRADAWATLLADDSLDVALVQEAVPAERPLEQTVPNAADNWRTAGGDRKFCAAIARLRRRAKIDDPVFVDGHRLSRYWRTSGLPLGPIVYCVVIKRHIRKHMYVFPEVVIPLAENPGNRLLTHPRRNSSSIGAPLYLRPVALAEQKIGGGSMATATSSA